MNQAAQDRIEQLEANEELRVATELNNPLNEPAVQVQTLDRHVIGYAPRYLAKDLAATRVSTDVEARVVQVNPAPSVWEHRILIKFVGTWDDHEPMSGPDYQPLVN